MGGLTLPSTRLAGGGDLDGRVLHEVADIELEAFNDRCGVRDCLLKLGIVQVAVLRIAAGIDEDGDVAAVGEVEDVNPLRVYSAESRSTSCSNRSRSTSTRWVRRGVQGTVR